MSKRCKSGVTPVSSVAGGGDAQSALRHRRYASKDAHYVVVIVNHKKINSRAFLDDIPTKTELFTLVF